MAFNRLVRKTFAIITVFLILVTSQTVIAATKYPFSPDDLEIVKAQDWMRRVQRGDGAIGSYSISAWATMSIAALRQDPHTWKKPNGFSIVEHLRNNVVRLNDPTSSATDYERNLLAITASHEDPTNFGGIDFIKKVKGFFDGEQIGNRAFLNDDFFGIISLISAGEDQNSEIIQASRNYILNNRNADGGWSYSVGVPSDVDDTAAAIMALAAIGYPQDQEVIDSAVQFLKSRQNSDGGFPFFSGDSSAASTAWAIQAIVASGDNPISEFWKTELGFDPVDGLLSLQSSNGSFQCFLDSIEAISMSTSYSVTALLGEPYPVISTF